MIKARGILIKAYAVASGAISILAVAGYRWLHPGNAGASGISLLMSFVVLNVPRHAPGMQEQESRKLRDKLLA